MTAPSIEEALDVMHGRVECNDLSSSRQVYLAPSGWVYKFDAEGTVSWTPRPQNQAEWEIYLFLKDNMGVLPERTAIPEMVALYDSRFKGGMAIASKYVEVEDYAPDCDESICNCPYDRTGCWWEQMGYCNPPDDSDERLIYDLWGNVFYDTDGVYWLLDLGFGSDKIDKMMENRKALANA